MNTQDMLELLYNALSLSGFIFHNQFLEELTELLKKDLKGKESIFFKQLTTQLKNIKSFGADIGKVDGHERLKGGGGHYHSIHFKHSQFNVRFIIRIDSDGVTYFLCAFNERAGKRQTDYSAYIDVMARRYEELKGESYNE
ncbi:MAG: hypothetical protein LUE23_06710 [Lachnospiraceae bacterium]|nr:hypothetical protein [Lachnospiraceae bacterium]